MTSLLLFPGDLVMPNPRSPVSKLPLPLQFLLGLSPEIIGIVVRADEGPDQIVEVMWCHNLKVYEWSTSNLDLVSRVVKA